MAYKYVSAREKKIQRLRRLMVKNLVRVIENGREFSGRLLYIRREDVAGFNIRPGFYVNGAQIPLKKIERTDEESGVIYLKQLSREDEE